MFSLCFAAPNTWRVLGLSEGASKEEIKAAYRRLALKYHPDVDKSREAPKRFLEVQQAYKALISADQGTSAPETKKGRPVRHRPPPKTAASALAPAPSKQRRSERRTAWRNGSTQEERPLSEMLDKFLPSRETFAYGMLFLILAPYVLSLFYSASYLLSSWNTGR